MTPIIIPIPMSTGGNIDGRERCTCCGQVLPKDRHFMKWISNTYMGIFLQVLCAVPGIGFIVLTLTWWMMGGVAFSDDILAEPHRSLMQCIWMNLHSSMHQMRAIFISGGSR